MKHIEHAALRRLEATAAMDFTIAAKKFVSEMKGSPVSDEMQEAFKPPVVAQILSNLSELVEVNPKNYAIVGTTMPDLAVGDDDEPVGGRGPGRYPLRIFFRNNRDTDQEEFVVVVRPSGVSAGDVRNAVLTAFRRGDASLDMADSRVGPAGLTVIFNSEEDITPRKR